MPGTGYWQGYFPDKNVISIVTTVEKAREIQLLWYRIHGDWIGQRTLQVERQVKELEQLSGKRIDPRDTACTLHVQIVEMIDLQSLGLQSAQ